MYIYTSAMALCAWSVTRLSILLSDFCSPTLAYSLHYGNPLIRTGGRREVSLCPQAAFGKHDLCYSSVLVFTIPLSGSII